MKRLILLVALCVNFMVGFSIDAKTLYSCFLSQDLNMNTNEVSNQVSNNSLIDIYVDGNKLLLGSKRYSMYNRQESNSGFVKIVHYDAIDGEGQRCKIKFITDPSADWVTINAIVIWYDEISPVAKWYQSRDPQER